MDAKRVFEFAKRVQALDDRMNTAFPADKRNAAIVDVLKTLGRHDLSGAECLVVLSVVQTKLTADLVLWLSEHPDEAGKSDAPLGN